MRSKTAVHEQLLDGSSVRFVATATAGFDHVDTAYLSQRGIKLSVAAGSNANSVAEYVVAALLHLHEMFAVPLTGQTVAVIGAGQVGGRVARKAAALGCRVLLNDPPLQAATGDPQYRTLAEILPQADIVTLHVPLTEAGPYATRHMADAGFFAQLKPGVIFINAARGEVVDESALQAALRTGAVRYAVLDVWEHEPAISRELLAQAVIGTPHIAGYSWEGRVNGTVAVYQDACRFLGVNPTWCRPVEDVPVSAPLDLRACQPLQALTRAVQQLHPLLRVDAALREGTALSAGEWAAHFNQLRAKYPRSYEFASVPLKVRQAPLAALEILRALGFNVTAVD